MNSKELSLTERVILANQYTIMAKLSPDEADSYEKKVEILESGYEGLYYEIFQHFDEPVSSNLTSEVHHILSMYRYITPAISALSEQEREDIKTDLIVFQGFDANNDTHYAIADFYINKMDLYAELKDMYLNSHSEFPLMKYRKMLERFNVIQSSHPGFLKLSKEDLESLVDSLNR